MWCAGSASLDRKHGRITRPKTKRRKLLLRGLGSRLKTVAAAHPGKRIRLMFEDEAHIGQKGRVCPRWYVRGQRPPGRADQRYPFAYVFTAVEPGTDNAFALVLPEVSTRTMQIYLDELSATIDVDEHGVLVLDQAGWHGANALGVPANITLLPCRLVRPNSTLSNTYGCS